MQSAPVDGTHKTINQRIDEVYLDTIDQGAHLLDHLDNPHGKITGAYQRFKNPFYQLFLLTYNLKEMRGCNTVSEEVRKWFESRKIDKNNAKMGLDLFTQYQKCLFDNLIISRREGR